MPDLQLRFKKDMLTVAPLLTVPLLDETLDEAENLEYFNILDEDLVRETYLRFRMAGAECALANTLQANALALEAFGLTDALCDINRAGIRLAREAGFEHVIAPLLATAEEVLCEQAQTLLLEMPDAFYLVGTDDDCALKCAIDTLKTMTDVPICAPASCIDEEVGIIYLADLNLEDSLSELESLAATCNKPLLICPKPDAIACEFTWQRQQALDKNVDRMVDFALEARAQGAQLIGTSAGSLPVYTGAISAAISGLDVTV